MRYQTKDLLLAGAFGWLTGMRSMAGPATVGRKLLRVPHAADLLAAAAAGEMLVDKHPATPNRNTAAPLAARTIAGAATGAAIVLTGSGWRRGTYLKPRRYRHHLSHGEAVEAAAVGAIIGGVFAFAATHMSYRARKLVGEKTNAPNVALGAAEDILVYGAAITLSDALD